MRKGRGDDTDYTNAIREVVGVVRYLERNKTLNLPLSRNNGARISVQKTHSQYYLKLTHLYALAEMNNEHGKADSFRTEKDVRRENEVSGVKVYRREKTYTPSWLYA